MAWTRICSHVSSMALQMAKTSRFKYINIWTFWDEKRSLTFKLDQQWFLLILAILLRSTFVLLSVPSQQLGDGFPWKSIQEFMVRRGWTVMTVVTPWLLLDHTTRRSKIQMCPVLWLMTFPSASPVGKTNLSNELLTRSSWVTLF